MPTARKSPRQDAQDARDALDAKGVRTTKSIGSLKRRLGSRLFNDSLALHFSTSRPPQEVWTNHPVMVVVIEHLQRARARGEISRDADPLDCGVFFLVGLHALLLTLPDSRAIRSPVLEQYVRTTLHGLAPR